MVGKIQYKKSLKHYKIKLYCFKLKVRNVEGKNITLSFVTVYQLDGEQRSYLRSQEDTHKMFGTDEEP